MFHGILSPLSRSIKAKLSVLVAASVASAVLLGAITSAWREADRRYLAASLELDGIGKAFAATVAAPLANNDAQNIGRALTAVGRIPKLKFVQVLDTQGRSLFQFGSGVLLKMPGKPEIANQSLNLFARLNFVSHVVETPVISGGVEVGTLRMIADLSELRTALAESVVSALFAALIAAGLGFLVAGRLQQAITGPINDLTSAMQYAQRSHDFSTVVPKRADDETGVMVDAFNDMLSQIRERDARLALQMENLEHQVLARTSELNLAKIAAESANASKSDFLATMSHEIRTPLNGIMVTAELMSASDLPPRLQRHADTIVTSGQSLLTIINDILDLSKIEAGRMELESVPVDPAHLVNQVLSLFAARAASKGIDLAGYVAPEVPRSISADPVRLTQVLSNLVNNALKFTSEGSVSIEVQMNTRHPAVPGDCAALTFRITDTGLGIAEDKLDHIFEAFSQADQSTARKFGGTGIGLSISRRLIAAMGGEIAVISEVGSGSCFYFTVTPLVLEAGTSRVEGARAIRTIAVDLPENASRHAVVRMLADQNIAATAANAASTPLAVLTTPDRLAKRIAESKLTITPAGGARPATFLLSNIGNTDAMALIEQGHADYCIIKPVAPADIAELADALTHGKQIAAPVRKSAPRAMANLPKFLGLRVLAAEDSSVNRQILAEALDRLGIRATLVQDGQAAVDAVARETFDLVLMDCSMPVMDGFDAARAIRAREADLSLPALPVVALTAHVTGPQANAWQSAGMSDYISKPYTLKSLATCIDRWAGASAQAHATNAAASQGDNLNTNCGPAHHHAILNSEVIEGIRDMQAGGDNLVARICGLFKLHGPEGLNRIAVAVETGDMRAIASAAHALKSLSRNIGAERLAAILDDLEDAARAGKTLPLHAALPRLSAELDGVMSAVDRVVAEMALADAGPIALRA